MWCAFPEEAQSAGKSFPGHRTASQLVCSIHVCPRPLLLPPGAIVPFLKSKPDHVCPSLLSVHDSHNSKPFTRPSRPSADPALLPLQPQPTSGGLCSFCPEPPTASCRLTPISSFLWEVSLGIREGSPVPQPNLSAPHPRPPYYQEARLLLCVSHRVLSCSREALSPSWPRPGAKRRPHLESIAKSTRQTGLHENQSQISDFSFPTCSLLFPYCLLSRAPLPGHPGHGIGDSAGLGPPKEGSHAHGVGAHVLKDQPVPYV